MGKFKSKYQWKNRKQHFFLRATMLDIISSILKQTETDVLRYGMFDSCYSKRETVGVKSLIAPGRSPVDSEPTRFEGEEDLASKGYDHPSKEPGTRKDEWLTPGGLYIGEGEDPPEMFHWRRNHR